jgi:5'-AMP-activated protein kinase catalytic alpha subunit
VPYIRKRANGLIVGINEIPVNARLIRMLEEKYSFNSEYARKCLHSNKHNHVTTTYYLLQKKYEGLGFDDDEKEK